MTTTAASIGIRIGSATFLAIAVATMAGASAPDALPRAANDDWIELRSPNFTFVSQSSTRLTERLAVELEELHSVVARLAGGSPRDPVPTTIFVFDRSRTFRPSSTPMPDGSMKTGG